MMKAAANYTRDHLQTYDEDLPIVRSQSFSAIARAVWTQSIPLAETLLLRSNIAKKFIEIKESQVQLKDPTAFSEAADLANRTLLDDRARELLTRPQSKGRESRAKRITNFAKLWVPLSKRFVISGIKVDGNIIRSEPELSLATGCAWQPTFNPKAFDEQAAETFLQSLGNIGEYSQTPPPDFWVYYRTIYSMGDTMPGNDGLPYSSWRSSGVRGVRCLMNTDLDLRRGISPPPSFNESGILFAPKGSQPHDPVEVIREPLQTRPLSLKNSDNKLIVASNVKSLEPQYQLITHKTQNGFVAGRNFLNNILDLDSAGRIFSMVYESECENSNPSNIPILGAFDYEAAFPSVIHGWIWLVLKHRRLPKDYINLFKGIYHKARATFCHGKSKFTLIDFLSGVLQGCPGSAFLFNNSLDPFLNMIHTKLREANRGISRGCADDIGVILARLKHLQLLYPIFQNAEEFAGLKLKPAKCVLVPLCNMSDKCKKDISKWLRRNIPEWANFSIEDTTKLLGFYIGPGAGRKNWTEQASKMRSRVQSIQHATASVNMNVHTFNTRVVPITSYVAQLLVVPDSFMQLERTLMHTTLRLPQNALCHADFLHLHSIGGPKFRSVVVSSVSALVRTALKTVTSWPSWIRQLECAALQWLPLEPLVKEKLSTMCWDSPPIALNLREASLGLPKYHLWSKALPDIICSLKYPPVLSSEPRGITSKCYISASVQKFVYSKLISHKFVNSLNDTVTRRLTMLYRPYSLDFQNSILLERCWATLRENSVSVVIRVLKCWCNGWASSRRYHEDKLLPCLFGCNQCNDELEHYFQCPHLFALWSFHTGGTSADPLVRWGLSHPDALQLKYVSCVFSGYHAVRRHFRRVNEFFEFNQSLLTGAQLRTSWSVFADAFFVEARELSIYCSRFSLPSFLAYLNSDDARPSFFNHQ